MKGVFEINGSSHYDDFIAERYHFPSKYLPNAQAMVGDWIVYRETRADGGRMAYIAAAIVDRIDRHPDGRAYYARMRSFIEFDQPVSFRSDGRYAERVLREVAPRDVGRTLHGNSVRPLDEDDFAEIVAAGLTETLKPENAVRLGLTGDDIGLLLQEPDFERRIAQLLVNRKIRDANFRRHVLDAYDDTCAVTGIRIINGGGKAEAQGAHIWSVADGGPDIVQNGIALSATAHWLFDRHLISLDENFGLLVSHNKVPSQLLSLFPPAGQPVGLPRDERLYPRAEYVARHRERFAGLTH